LQLGPKNLRYAWCLYRRSVKSRRDPTAFAREADNQQALQQMSDQGLINLFYFDASGFATAPCVSYAWQPLGATRELPSFPSQRSNILGFLSRDQPAFFQAVENPVVTAQAIAAFDRFASGPCHGVMLYSPYPAGSS
jgi:hypothetical protein